MAALPSDAHQASSDSPSVDILVVDDNAANLLAMEAALGLVGGRVVRAHSGEEALRMLLDHDFALILLDVQMPSLGGFETARLIRERRRSRHTPIIFVTAHDRDEQDVLAAYKLGAVDFLFKPVVAEILQSKVGVFVELQRRTMQVTRQSELLREHERRAHERTLEEERRRWEEEALRRKVVEMAEADKRKDEFLAVLGHELRNPLSAIVVGCELLTRKLASTPGVDEAVLRARDRIDRQAQHLRRLVDDLLDLARINSGKIELKKSFTSIQHVVEQAVVSTLPSIEEHGHKLTVELPPEPVTLWADPDRLIQIIANLLNNSARYTDDGGSIVVTGRVRGEDGLLEIRVSDNGRGIGPELLPRVFDIFFQEQGRGTGHGLGLGLTIVKRLVAMHQGAVVAASAGAGQGSTFTITLPLHPARGTAEIPAEIPASRGTAAPSPSAKSLSIVLVEDNADMRESLKELLIGLGHSVHTANDGGSGVELILRLEPDVAIVDLGLPVLDGYRVAQQVRSRLGRERVRLVAMTGYGQDADRARSREAGFDTHLVKPADMSAVIEILSAREN
jgi:two-component system, sensor histidine kinase